VERRNRKLASIYLLEKGYPIGSNRLAQLATTGEGPPFRYWGRYTIYTEEDLDAWAESRFRAGPKAHTVNEAAPAGRDEEPLLSPPTRQGRKYRKRSGSRKTNQSELFAEKG
jgi:hypothetical protein